MPQKILRYIHETGAVAVWNHNTGPLFWYAAGVPGPFYVNTEKVVGAKLSEELLHGITDIIATTDNADKCAEKLNTLILGAHDSAPQYQNVIQALADRIQRDFPADRYDVISGGERRDWIFSIPVAKLLNKPHLFLYKNKQSYCATPVTARQRALHVADLINNAASYFDAWLPILSAAELTCVGTACINTRGNVGLNRLDDAGYKVTALNHIDIEFFRQSYQAGLIDVETLEELTTYFRSDAEWAVRYLLDKPTFFTAGALDAKSKERLNAFIRNDPWRLRNQYNDFFEAISQ